MVGNKEVLGCQLVVLFVEITSLGELMASNGMAVGGSLLREIVSTTLERSLAISYSDRTDR